MRWLSPSLDYYWKIVSDKFLRLRKIAYQFRTIRHHSAKKTILFIFGCQRSGTTLLAEIFERDFDNTQVYHEFSRLSSADTIHHIRLNPLHLIKTEISNTLPSLIVLKPLVESQNASILLDYFENSKGLWMYRHYKDVALSNLKLWGINNGINNLRPIAEGHSQNWRSEHVSGSVKQIVTRYFSEDMDPYDAAALFWFVRNSIFFDLGLDKDLRVITCTYEELTEDFGKTMSYIYKFAGYTFPLEKININIYASSTDRRKHIRLSKQIEYLCNELLEKLDRIHQLKMSQNA